MRVGLASVLQDDWTKMMQKPPQINKNLTKEEEDTSSFLLLSIQDEILDLSSHYACENSRHFFEPTSLFQFYSADSCVIQQIVRLPVNRVQMNKTIVFRVRNVCHLAVFARLW